MTDQDKELRMRISLLMDSDLDGRDNPRLIVQIGGGRGIAGDMGAL